MGKLKKAEDFTLRCLKILERFYGENCIQSESVLNSLAYIYSDMGNL